MPISVASPGELAIARPIRALVRSALALERRRPGEIAVVLGDDALLRGLNRRYRGLDRTTDVLSFVYHEEPAAASPRRAPPVAGDVVISLDRVREQARRFRVSRGRELARLVIHGALHLAGLDHRVAAERRAMRAREDRALRAAASAVRELDRRLGPAGRGARRAPRGR